MLCCLFRFLALGLIGSDTTVFVLFFFSVFKFFMVDKQFPLHVRNEKTNTAVVVLWLQRHGNSGKPKEKEEWPLVSGLLERNESGGQGNLLSVGGQKVNDSCYRPHKDQLHWELPVNCQGFHLLMTIVYTCVQVSKSTLNFIPFGSQCSSQRQK